MESTIFTHPMKKETYDACHTYILLYHMHAL